MHNQERELCKDRFPSNKLLVQKLLENMRGSLPGVNMTLTLILKIDTLKIDITYPISSLIGYSLHRFINRT